MSRSLKAFLFILSFIAVLAIGFVVWAGTPARPMPEALTALQSDANVTVTQGQFLVFKPAHSEISTGLIFYPGARVDYRAYAPAMRRIAEQGYLVVLVRMPLNLAVFNPNAALDVTGVYSDIGRWAVGGHSLGGAMAASFARDYSGLMQGFVLWAAYPASGTDLTDTGLKAASISGSLDGLATPDKIEASRLLLPPDTLWTAIPGGNHAQFGWYGDQNGDNSATISRAEQQEQVIAATLRLLESLE